MHLVAYGAGSALKPFYHSGTVLARRGSLAHLFYRLRINRNLTIERFSAKIGIKRDYLSKVETGSIFPSLSFCLKSAKEFDVNPEYVKNRWAREAVQAFSERLRRRLKLFE